MFSFFIFLVFLLLFLCFFFVLGKEISWETENLFLLFKKQERKFWKRENYLMVFTLRFCLLIKKIFVFHLCKWNGNIWMVRTYLRNTIYSPKVLKVFIAWFIEAEVMLKIENVFRSERPLPGCDHYDHFHLIDHFWRPSADFKLYCYRLASSVFGRSWFRVRSLFLWFFRVRLVENSSLI